MLAKVIAWAPTRAEAARRLSGALASAKLHGLTTNRDLLVRVLRHPAFLAGDTDTAFFAKHDLETLAQTLADNDCVRLSALAAALAEASASRASARVLGRLPSGWRNVVSQPQVRVFGEHQVRYLLTRSGLTADGFDGVSLVDATPTRVVLDVSGVRRTFDVASYSDIVCVDSPLGPVTLERTPRFVDPATQVPAGSLLAPMPGSVVRVAVSEGDSVTEGQPLLWLEAMKMEHKIVAPATGVVASLPVTAGDQVEVGAVLAVVSAEEQS
jgi:propionyl-CoA carboxylase alpha chain